MNPSILRILLTKEMKFMKNNVLQNLEIVRKKELPPVRPEGTPVKAPTQDPYGTDDPDTLDVRAASVTDCTGLIPSGTGSGILCRGVSLSGRYLSRIAPIHTG